MSRVINWLRGRSPSAFDVEQNHIAKPKNTYDVEKRNE